MANFVYKKSLQYYEFPSIVSQTIQVSLLKQGVYTPDPAADEFYDVIPPAAIAAVGTAPLSGKSFTGGEFRADDMTFGPVAAVGVCDAIVLWHDTGNPATSRLLVYIDTYTGLPVTPDGINWVNVQWPRFNPPEYTTVFAPIFKI
ncbi:MAG: hypothetical protein ABIN58_00800 [candidate division WOR-3 bacterium]